MGYFPDAWNLLKCSAVAQRMLNHQRSLACTILILVSHAASARRKCPIARPSQLLEVSVMLTMTPKPRKLALPPPHPALKTWSVGICSRSQEYRYRNPSWKWLKSIQCLNIIPDGIWVRLPLLPTVYHTRKSIFLNIILTLYPKYPIVKHGYNPWICAS